MSGRNIQTEHPYWKRNTRARGDVHFKSGLINTEESIR